MKNSKLRAFSPDDIKYARQIEKELRSLPPAKREVYIKELETKNLDRDAQILAKAFGGEVVN